MSKNYTEIFTSMLQQMEFELVKHEDGYGLKNMDGSNIGDIEWERFDNASQIINELDSYLEDIYYKYLEESYKESYGDAGMPFSTRQWLKFMNSHEIFKESHKQDYEILDMIAYHLGEVELDKALPEQKKNRSDKQVERE